MAYSMEELQIEVLSGMSYILCALDNAAPNTPEIRDVYFCVTDNLTALRKKADEKKLPDADERE